MQLVLRRVVSLIAFAFAVISLAAVSALAQVVVATLPSDYSPFGVATNTTTNKIYVTNQCGVDPTCGSAGTVTVIDGSTLSTQSVQVGLSPYLVALNAATNKIYVVNYCGSDLTCSSAGTVTVIDGSTLATQTVNVGYSPYGIAVNSVTNKIYVVNECGSDNCQSTGTVTAIDGATLSTQSVTVGISPYGVAVNSVTNKIWVANECGSDPSCQSNGTATVIDGVTLATQSVTLNLEPYDVAVNAATNKIYIDNYCGTDLGCASNGTVSVIDGNTLSTQSVAVGSFPYDVEVNAVTNKIYVANSCGSDPTCSSKGTVTIIDGATLNTSAVAVGAFPTAEAIDSTANKIYVVNECGNDPTCSSNGGIITVIDGVTGSTTPVAVGDYPWNAAVNPSTNQIYVPNNGDATVSVIGGATTLQLVNVTPCRLVDTRPQYGGNGPIQGGTSQSFPIPQEGGCNIPTTAVAYSLNVSVVPSGPLGYLTIWPTGESQPLVATLNSLDGRIKADAAIVPAGTGGAVSVYVTNTTNVILDINGYFAPASGSTLAFYPLPPCRVADTRNSSYPQGLGPPYLPGHTERQFPILNATSCNIPSTAAAYSLNLSVVPHGPLGYLTVWPTGQTRPLVSTLNDIPGTIIANAAIVPAGTGGDVSVYPSSDTDLVIDINGYFAPAGQGGLSLYPTVPCRVIDTRLLGPPFSGTLTPPVDVVDSPCGLPVAAQAYVFNATVVPQGVLGYLTLWPDGDPKPLVSTLNALDGSITNNMAIVPSTNGKVDAYASGITQLILDISSYFAP